MEAKPWLKSRVNFNQPPEERRAKYSLCQRLGDNCPLAARRRDWRFPKIARAHGYHSKEAMFDALGLEQAAFIASFKNGGGAEERGKCLNSTKSRS